MMQKVRFKKYEKKTMQLPQHRKKLGDSAF